MLDRETNTLEKEYFNYWLNIEMKRAKRYQYCVSLLMLEINGNSEGKDLSDIIAALDLVRSEIRDFDIIGRQDVSRFSLLISYTDERSTFLVGERIRGQLQALFLPPGQTSEKAFYLGGCCYPTHVTSFSDIMGKAGQMLDEAKKTGKRLVLP